MRQITDGLVKSRVDASVAEARTETATARERLGSAGGNDFDPDTQLRLLVENLVARGRGQGLRGRGARSGRRRQHRRAAYAPRRPWTPSSVPQRSADAVESGEDGLAWTYTRIHYTRVPTRRRTPHVPARGGGRLDRRAARPTAAATRSTTCSRWRRSSRRCCCCARCCSPPACSCCVLVAGVALLVTRQVITPVRLARRVAERIASGRLEERMHVSRRGRHRPARHVVQPDGRGAAVADPPAGGALPGAAHVRLRRLPRAAHPADHGADGRRRAARRPGDLRPDDRAGRRAAAERARPVREPARRPARDQPVRRRRRRPRPRGHQPRSTSPTGSSRRRRRWRCSAA